MEITLTFIGTATLLLEIGTLRLLTDPAFDPADSRYEQIIPNPPLTIPLHKQMGPAVEPDQLGHIDAVLLSHDQHWDNLDKAGRGLLPQADQVLTTRSGAARLGGNARGLKNWESLVLSGGQGERVRVTAVPARHGPLATVPLLGEVIGFVLEIDELPEAIYISGDTVYYRGLKKIGQRFNIGTAILHLGSGCFPATGKLRFSLDGAAGAKLAAELNPTRVIPIHHAGWAHFSEGEEEAAAAFTAAGLGEKLLQLTPGVPLRLNN